MAADDQQEGSEDCSIRSPTPLEFAKIKAELVKLLVAVTAKTGARQPNQGDKDGAKIQQCQGHFFLRVPLDSTGHSVDRTSNNFKVMVPPTQRKYTVASQEGRIKSSSVREMRLFLPSFWIWISACCDKKKCSDTTLIKKVAGCCNTRLLLLLWSVRSTVSIDECHAVSAIRHHAGFRRPATVACKSCKKCVGGVFLQMMGLFFCKLIPFETLPYRSLTVQKGLHRSITAQTL